MASADDAHSRPKRPTAMARQSSSQSHLSQSPGETHHRPQHKVQHRHAVGHRVQRNLSGKNLSKLNKAAREAQQAQAQTQDKEARHHKRSNSGNSVSAPTSPRPSFKRNASSGGIVRAAHQAHTQANLRKNHSSGHLARQGQTKSGLKSSKSEIAPPRKSLASRSRQTSPEGQPSVHFAMASEEEEEEEEKEEEEEVEGGDDGWTEESASQSPTTTRSNTRSNSVILDAQHKLAERNMENNRGDPSQTSAQMQPSAQPSQALPDRTARNTTSSHHSRPPDADLITSRLLQRSTSQNVTPQTSSVAATVVSASSRHNLLSHSAGSTLVDTPGRDLVSRFMDGEGSAGTPKDGQYMPAREFPDHESGQLDQSKRNKSMPNVSGSGGDTPNKTPSRSGATTPTTNLPPSRTQQKLMLQRASSNIEPQKLVPVTLPRTGGPAFLQQGLHYNANGEGRLDPRLQQQFNHVAVEYNVVRRYRNPIGDAIIRIQQIPGMSIRKAHRNSRNGGNGYVNVHGSTPGTGTGSSSLSTSFNEAGGLETDGAGSSRRSAHRVSFDNDGGQRPRSRRGGGPEGDGLEGRQSYDSDRSRRTGQHGGNVNEAEEICRRLWESAEVVEGE